MARTVRVVGDRGRITLDELEDFVKAARDAGVRSDEEISADVSSSGKLKELEVEIW